MYDSHDVKSDFLAFLSCLHNYLTSCASLLCSNPRESRISRAHDQFHRITRNVMEEPLEALSLGSSRANIPAGWSDRPETLGLGTTFTQDRINEALHPSHQFSHAKPILKNTESEYIFEEKGKYYLWNAVSGRVSEIREDSLNDMLRTCKVEDYSP